jgi:hypothetical protein
VKTPCQDGPKWHSLRTPVLFKHPIHFFMILLTFKTDSFGGCVYFAVLLSLNYGLMLLSDSPPICTFLLQWISSHPLGVLLSSALCSHPWVWDSPHNVTTVLTKEYFRTLQISWGGRELVSVAYPDINSTFFWQQVYCNWQQNGDYIFTGPFVVHRTLLHASELLHPQ